MILRSLVSVRVRSLCGALGPACALLLPSVTIGADKCGSLDRVVIAIRLARTLYPEVKGREFSVAFSEGTGGPVSGAADARSLSITLDKPRWHPPGKSSGQPDVAPLSAPTPNDDAELPLYLNFSFIDMDSVGRDVVCRPVQFMKSHYTNPEAVVHKLLNAHPEWTDAEELKAATKKGMRFGPDNKAAVLRLIPLKELNAFYGPLRIKKVRFSVAGIKEPGSSFADLRWYIDAQEVGTPRALQITVEPFRGRIDSISEYREPR